MKKRKIAAFYSESSHIPFKTFQQAARRATQDSRWYKAVNEVPTVWMTFFGESLRTLAGYKKGKRWKKANGAK